MPDGNSPERNWHQAGASSEFEYPIIIREKWAVNQRFLIFAECSLVRILRDIRGSFPADRGLREAIRSNNAERFLLKRLYQKVDDLRRDRVEVVPTVAASPRLEVGLEQDSG